MAMNSSPPSPSARMTISSGAPPASASPAPAGPRASRQPGSASSSSSSPDLHSAPVSAPPANPPQGIPPHPNPVPSSAPSSAANPNLPSHSGSGSTATPNSTSALTQSLLLSRSPTSAPNPSLPPAPPTGPSLHRHYSRAPIHITPSVAPRQPLLPDSRPLSRSGSGSFDCPPHSPALEPPPHQSVRTLFDPLPSLPSRLRQATLKLVPPPNFGFVEGLLYRAGEPAELSFAFLERLRLRSLLWLAPKPPAPRFRQFLDRSGTTFHDLSIQHAASLDAVTEEAVTQALRLILNPTMYPLMIMCAGGSHRTGTVVGCLRKLQGWNLASIFEEYRRYAGAQHHIMNEQFIEFYNIGALVNGLSAEEEENALADESPPRPPSAQLLQRATPSGLTQRTPSQ